MLERASQTKVDEADGYRTELRVELLDKVGRSCPETSNRVIRWMEVSAKL